MNILSAQGLSKAHGLRTLFSQVTLGIEERDRIALIGVNGSGKSTLLKALAGVDPPDEGIVATRQNLRIEYLPQDPVFAESRTVLDQLFSDEREEAVLAREYASVCRELEAAPDDAAFLARLEELTHRMDAAGAWGFETRAKTVLTKLGIVEFNAPVAQLSGGYRKRVALAHALLADAELLVLDEPTNHLDADTIGWLEEYMVSFSGAVLLVTHDRYFLDRVARRILEIENGGVRSFDGNYSYYLEHKSEMEAAAVVMEERRRAILRKEIAWLKRGAKARTTKQKARIQRIGELREQGPPRARDAILFSVLSPRLGKKVVRLEGVSKSYDDQVLIRKFTHTFAAGERLGVIGPNGCGKTTLAQLILGSAQPDYGHVEVGETVRFACFQQEYRSLDPRIRAVDFIKEEGGEMLRSPDGTFLTAESVMEKFLFTSQNQYTPIEKLSGGERRRLELVATLMRDPNFLILDEPTNDLDIQTLRALEDFLDGYGGCLLAISHDRYFLDRTVDRVLSFEGKGELRMWPGSYTTYARLRAEEDSHRRGEEARRARARGEVSPGGPSAETSGAESKPRQKMTYKEKRELERLEVEIPRMEARMAEIESEMAAAAADYGRLTALTQELNQLSIAIEAALERWEELAERAQG